MTPAELETVARQHIARVLLDGFSRDTRVRPRALRVPNNAKNQACAPVLLHQYTPITDVQMKYSCAHLQAERCQSFRVHDVQNTERVPHKCVLQGRMTVQTDSGAECDPLMHGCTARHRPLVTFRACNHGAQSTDRLQRSIRLVANTATPEGERSLRRAPRNRANQDGRLSGRVWNRAPPGHAGLGKPAPLRTQQSGWP
jgi:hypothetical protein